MNFYKSVGVEADNNKEIRNLAKKLDISVSQLNFYNNYHILPYKDDLSKILEILNISKLQLQIRMGIIDENLKNILIKNEDKLIIEDEIKTENKLNFTPSYSNKFGTLFQGDCIEFLKQIEDSKYDLIFADPPFNLDKFYLSEIDDNLTSNDYLNWCYNWIDECIRTLKPGGSFFIWNLPNWNIHLANYLNNRMLFRHWIATDIKFSLPINGRLYPSHYSLIYFTKGKPKFFKPDRLPMQVCKKCMSDLKDYGGYKNKMNPSGINLTDVWYDIPPVRHTKYKKRKEANELSIKLLDRIIEMASKPGDLVFDPFGGSGTTYIIAQLKNRNWEGIELGPLDDIISRFDNIENDKTLLLRYRKNYNKLFPDKIKEKRKQLKIWTDETYV